MDLDIVAQNDLTPRAVASTSEGQAPGGFIIESEGAHATLKPAKEQNVESSPDKSVSSTTSSVSSTTTTTEGTASTKSEENVEPASVVQAEPVLAEEKPLEASNEPPKPPKRRVKVYRLDGEQWLDLGTGICAIHTEPLSNETKPLVMMHEPELDEDADAGPWICVTPEPPESKEKKAGEEDSPSRKRKREEEEADQAKGPPEREIWRTAVRSVLFMAATDGDRGSYQRQQDTLIVWTETDGTDMALSFANVTGCNEIWSFIERVRQYLFDSDLTSSDEDEFPANARRVQSEEMSRQPQTSSSPPGAALYRSGGMSTAGRISAGTLPEPSLSNLSEVETMLKWISRTPLGRERLSTWVIHVDYAKQLIDLFHDAEDLESLESLHSLCVIVQGLLLLNDNAMFEYILQDELFIGIAGILEYDPEYPTLKANYRDHLSDPKLYREVVPIRHGPTQTKIHQTYRLQYLKDVILARIIDDPTFSMLNSFIFFHQVDIVQHLQSDSVFLSELFALFETPDLNPSNQDDELMIGPTLPKPAIPQPKETESFVYPTSLSQEQHDQQHGAILLLQQFCGLAKNLQIAARNTFYRTLADRGLLRVLERALMRTTHFLNKAAAQAAHITTTEEEQEHSLRVATIDILMMVIDHQPNAVRAYCLKDYNDQEAPETCQNSLMLFLIKLLLSERDLGIQAQMAEAIKVLVQTSTDGGAGILEVMRSRPEDPEAERFLDYFYKICVGELFKPLAELEALPKGATVTLDNSKASICAYLCDLMCYFVSAHTFRSKFYILSSEISKAIARLLNSTQKYLVLAAIRFFRATLNKKDDFYNRALIKSDLFLPILQAAKEEEGKDNLVASACLEFFEHIRTNNSKPILNHLMERHGALVRSLTPGNDTINLLVLRWEQNNEPPPEASTSAAVDNKNNQQSSSYGQSKVLDADEESYFNDSSSDDETTPAIVAAADAGRSKSPPARATSPPAKGMVRSPAQVFQEMAIRGAKGKARAIDRSKRSSSLVAYNDEPDIPPRSSSSQPDSSAVVAMPDTSEAKEAATSSAVAASLLPDDKPLPPHPPPEPDLLSPPRSKASNNLAEPSLLGSPFERVTRSSMDEDGPPPSLAALGEKRRREAEEDDQLGQLQSGAKKVKPNVKPSSTAKSASTGNQGNGLTSKFKLKIGSLAKLGSK